MLLTPILSGQEGSSLSNIALRLGTALAVVVGIIVTARAVVPFLLGHIVRLRSPEVFIIFVVLVSLGTAWLTSLFGMSMALGAFVAGLVLPESEYSHQIVSDIMPFRDVFNSVFSFRLGYCCRQLFVRAFADIVAVGRSDDRRQGAHHAAGRAIVGQFVACGRGGRHLAPDIIQREAETVRRAGYEVLPAPPGLSMTRAEADAARPETQPTVNDLLPRNR